MRISTADLAARGLFLRADVEAYLRENQPDDPEEALANALIHPHSFEFPRPYDLLCGAAVSRHWRDGVRPHVYSGELPQDSILRAGNGLYVTSPEMTLFQMARYVRDVHLMAALITELSGSYALLPPGLVNCSRYLERGMTPFKGTKLLCDGYADCEPITAVENLQWVLDRHPHLPGSKLVRKALMASGNGSASPFETYVDVTLQLGRSLGGIGVGKGEMNKKVTFNEVGRSLARRGHAYADLLLTTKGGRRIAVEPCGVFGHAGKGEMDADRRRRHALENAKIEVIDVTWDDFTDSDAWDAICRRIAAHMGKRFHAPTTQMRQQRRLVHDDFCNWDCLRAFPSSSWRDSRP